MAKKEKKVKQKCSTIENYKLTIMQKIYVAFKSFCDILIGIIASLLLLPIFIIVAIAIKIDSKGPVFFKQKRVGKNGKIYTCYKFRSMSVETPAYIESSNFKNKNYITKVGAFIRKTSIDELPQFLCLAFGTMSLIGYRPSLASEELLNEKRELYGVHQLKPGISGWAQVNGRDVLAACPDIKATYDAYYTHKISLWLDIKIVLKTIGSVFSSKDIVVDSQDALAEAEKQHLRLTHEQCCCTNNEETDNKKEETNENK